MYVLKNRNYGYCNFGHISTPAGGYANPYNQPLERAQRFATISDVLTGTQERQREVGSVSILSADFVIQRLISTPGTATRREVPLGTPGSKVAIRGVTDSLYVRNLDGVSGGKYGDINGARLFADIPAALEAMQEFMYGRTEYACSFATLVGILESTTEPTLTTEEVR